MYKKNVHIGQQPRIFLKLFIFRIGHQTFIRSKIIFPQIQNRKAITDIVLVFENWNTWTDLLIRFEFIIAVWEQSR